MRERFEKKKVSKDTKMKDDADFLTFVAEQMQKDKEKQIRYSESLKKEFIEYNDCKKQQNFVQKNHNQ